MGKTMYVCLMALVSATVARPKQSFLVFQRCLSTAPAEEARKDPKTKTNREATPCLNNNCYSRGCCRKSAVHRSAVRSNASSKFLQNYAGGRVRQPRTPNTSAERKFPKPNYTNTMSKRLFHPRLPHADVKLLLFAPDATRSVTGKQKHNKQRNKTKQEAKVFPLSVCLMSSYVTQQLLFIK